MATPQRTFWNGAPEELREAFTLTKPSGVRARCAIWTHMFGWEIRLDVKGAIVRTQVTRDPAAVNCMCDEWRSGMVAEGWNQG